MRLQFSPDFTYIYKNYNYAHYERHALTVIIINNIYVTLNLNNPKCSMLIPYEYRCRWQQCRQVFTPPHPSISRR